MAGHDFVFHLAANADVRFGTEHPRKDLEQNTIATFNVLEAMRADGVRRIAFSSTGSIYGEPEVFPTPETRPFPVQTLALRRVQARRRGPDPAPTATASASRRYIFRFVSILGERYTHGHVFDFYQKLRADPTTIEVLGNGKQRKSYLYVQDCVDAMLTGASSAPTGEVNVFNLGHRRVLHASTTRSAGSREHLGCRPAPALHRRRPRLDRRQPVHLPRHAHPGARLEAEADHPRGRRCGRVDVPPRPTVGARARERR